MAKFEASTRTEKYAKEYAKQHEQNEAKISSLTSYQTEAVDQIQKRENQLSVLRLQEQYLSILNDQYNPDKEIHEESKIYPQRVAELAKAYGSGPDQKDFQILVLQMQSLAPLCTALKNATEKGMDEPLKNQVTDVIKEVSGLYLELFKQDPLQTKAKPIDPKAREELQSKIDGVLQKLDTAIVDTEKKVPAVHHWLKRCVACVGLLVSFLGYPAGVKYCGDYVMNINREHKDLFNSMKDAKETITNFKDQITNLKAKEPDLSKEKKDLNIKDQGHDNDNENENQIKISIN